MISETIRVWRQRVIGIDKAGELFLDLGLVRWFYESTYSINEYEAPCSCHGAAMIVRLPFRCRLALYAHWHCGRNLMPYWRWRALQFIISKIGLQDVKGVTKEYSLLPKRWVYER